MSESDRSGETTRPAGRFVFDAIRPERGAKLPPCRANCPSGTPIRDWIADIAQCERQGGDLDAACERAWRQLVEFNPFPATMGRICPHPCEADCNRGELDGAVAVNELERFVGDWAIERGLSLPLPACEQRPESIGVIGAGPAGLSFAWQLRRRGYAVTVYDRHEKPGGMLRYGIPDYRLPPAVLDAEIERILQSGVRLESGMRAGIDIALEELQSRHQVLFLGLGAQQGRQLGIAGEIGANAWTGVEFLALHNEGRTPQIGSQVVVVGGGNTAIDAARVARRLGARVTMLYRRAREDMPAIAAEVEEALEEGVELLFHVTPAALIRDESGQLTAVSVQRMQAGATDASGRARAEPIPGETLTLLASSFISAVSQQTEWNGLEPLAPGENLVMAGEIGSPSLVAGGDITGLDLASHAIGQGRMVAERVHAGLRGLPLPPASGDDESAIRTVIGDHYERARRLVVEHSPVAERLASPGAEISQTISERQFRDEIARCFSCGLCNGCRQCWMYCAGHAFSALESPQPGQYFAFALDTCLGCGKCIDLCPTGFLSASEPTP